MPFLVRASEGPGVTLSVENGRELCRSIPVAALLRAERSSFAQADNTSRAPSTDPSAPRSISNRLSCVYAGYKEDSMANFTSVDSSTSPKGDARPCRFSGDVSVGGEIRCRLRDTKASMIAAPRNLGVKDLYLEPSPMAVWASSMLVREEVPLEVMADVILGISFLRQTSAASRMLEWRRSIEQLIWQIPRR